MHFMWFTERAYHYDPEVEPVKYRALENDIVRKRSFFGTANRFFDRAHGAQLLAGAEVELGNEAGLGEGEVAHRGKLVEVHKLGAGGLGLGLG